MNTGPRLGRGIWSHPWRPAIAMGSWTARHGRKVCALHAVIHGERVGVAVWQRGTAVRRSADGHEWILRSEGWLKARKKRPRRRLEACHHLLLVVRGNLVLNARHRPLLRHRNVLESGQVVRAVQGQSAPRESVNLSAHGDCRSRARWSRATKGRDLKAGGPPVRAKLWPGRVISVVAELLAHAALHHLHLGAAAYLCHLERATQEGRTVQRLNRSEGGRHVVELNVGEQVRVSEELAGSWREALG